MNNNIPDLLRNNLWMTPLEDNERVEEEIMGEDEQGIITHAMLD